MSSTEIDIYIAGFAFGVPVSILDVYNLVDDVALGRK